MIVVEVWGVGGKRWAYMYHGQRGFFCFCRSHLTNDGGFLHFRCEKRDDDNNNDPVEYFANNCVE